MCSVRYLVLLLLLFYQQALLATFAVDKIDLDVVYGLANFCC